MSTSKITKDQIKDLSDLLMAEWDPIGVRKLGDSADEYDFYAEALLAMLQSGASRMEIEKYLTDSSIKRMGLDDSSSRLSPKAADAVFNFWNAL